MTFFRSRDIMPRLGEFCRQAQSNLGQERNRIEGYQKAFVGANVPGQAERFFRRPSAIYAWKNYNNTSGLPISRNAIYGCGLGRVRTTIAGTIRSAGIDGDCEIFLVGAPLSLYSGKPR